MFGIIPRVLWERVVQPDAQHRILLETNCFLVRTSNSLGLIDTGYGGKAPPKFRRRHSLEDGTPLLRNMAQLGISPQDIDWVILTHLHFDHAGGCSYIDDRGALRPTFPRARHFVQRIEWDDAVGNLPELAGAYYVDDFTALQAAGLLELLDGPAEIAPGISTELTGGHTRGHQLVKFQSRQASAVLPTDIVPTAAHLETFWSLSYDQFPLTVRRVKPGILQDIVAHERFILFSHDPGMAVARLSQQADGRWLANAWPPAADGVS